jgi:hypothetical protein
MPASLPRAVADLVLVRSMAALNEFSGGARWGDIGWLPSYSTWPLAHLLVCDDRLLLTTPLGAYDFPRARIRCLSVRSDWLSRLMRMGVLQIEHEIREYPSFIAFSTGDIKSLRDTLSAAGFTVET